MNPRGWKITRGQEDRLAKYTPKVLHNYISTMVKLKRSGLDKNIKHIINNLLRVNFTPEVGPTPILGCTTVL